MPNSLRTRVSSLAFKGLITRDDANRIREALVKDIAKKPEHIISKYMGVTKEAYECPNCRNIVTTLEPKIISFANRNNYCDRCGQKLNWGIFLR